MLNSPIARYPVHVHVEDVHKDRDLQATATEDLGFVRLLNHYDASVCWANNFPISCRMLSWLVAEKVQHSEEESKRNNDRDDTKCTSIEGDEGIDANQAESKTTEWAFSFLV